MPDDGGFALELPPDRAGELESLMAAHDAAGMSNEELVNRARRMGAKDAPAPDPIIERMAKHARALKAMRDITRQKSPEQGVMSGQYETKLPPDQEAVFQVWKRQYAPRDSGADYDLRGAFKAGLRPDPKTGHWPDTFKKPNHPTFSNESMYAKQRPELAGSWQGERYMPPGAMGPPSPSREAERVEPGVMRGMGGLLMDPVDIATGGLMGGARAAARTGVSEALGKGAANVAGQAGLPPWLQSIVGLAAGLAPGLGKRATPPAEVPSEALIPEVLPFPAKVPTTVPRGFVPPRIPFTERPRLGFDESSEVFSPPAPAEPRMAANVGAYNPEQIAEQRRLAAPLLRLPPPTIRVSPEGVAERPRLRTRKEWETLDVPSISAKQTSRGIRPFESGRGVQPPGEPGPRTDIPPTLEEQQREIASIPAQLPEIVKRYGLKEPQVARQQFGNIAREVTTSRPEDAINPWGIPGIRDVQKQVRQFGREQFPSRASFSKADFADRLERQRMRDTATVSEGRRVPLTAGQSETRARLHAASQLAAGDKVLTPQGPGTVVERIKGAVTGRSINEIMASRGTRAEGRQTEWATERYAAAPSASVKIKLDDGREGTWSAANVLRLKDEAQSVGEIKQLPEEMRAKIRATGPKRGTVKTVTPPAREPEPPPEGDPDFDWATGQPKPK